MAATVDDAVDGAVDMMEKLLDRTFDKLYDPKGAHFPERRSDGLTQSARRSY